MSYKPRDRVAKDSDRDSDHSSHCDTHEPRPQASRLFVGNLSDRVSRADMEERFSKYGRVLNVSMQRGFAFVQYAREDVAAEAIKGETGTTLKGNRIEVGHALESKRRQVGLGRGRRGSPSPGDRSYRDRRDNNYDKEKDGRDRSAIRGEDRLRDSYRKEDRYLSRRENTKDDSRSFDMGRDYQRRRYDDNYLSGRVSGGRGRSEFQLEPINAYYKNLVLDPKRPNDCEIIVADKMLRVYAENVERQFENIGMLVDMAFAKDEAFVSQIIEDVTRRGTMYAVVISAQHEAHRSVTLNILQGSPQEHRNMPLDDAVKMVARKFNEFIQIRREKMLRDRGEAGPYGGFSPPDREMQFLFTQLADGKFLTVAELDRVSGYLRDRKEQLEGVSSALPPSATTNPTPAQNIQSTEQALAQKQQELQQKILSMINQNPSNAGVTSLANESASLKAIGQLPVPPQVPNTPQSQPKSPGYINFDNPNVQKALDNLMQSGPKLLESIGVAPTGKKDLDSSNLMQSSDQQRQLVNQPPGLGDVIPGLGNNSNVRLTNVNDISRNIDMNRNIGTLDRNVDMSRSMDRNMNRNIGIPDRNIGNMNRNIGSTDRNLGDMSRNLGDMNRSLMHQSMRSGSNFGFQGRSSTGPEASMNMGATLGSKTMPLDSERSFNLGGNLSQMSSLGSRGMGQDSHGMVGHGMASQVSRLGTSPGSYQGPPNQMRSNPNFRHPLMGTQLGNPSMQGRSNRF